jgi:mono/diheme cytochrome c family protein
MSADQNNFHVEQAAASDESIQQVHAQLQEKKPEKPNGYSAFPLVLLGVMCTVIFFGSIYLAHYSAHFDPLIYNEYQKPTKTAAAGPVITPAMLGKRVYSTTCIACHQANGQGTPGVYPPLAGSEWAQGSEERIVRIVLHGLTGPIHVEGKDFNNTMAALGGALKDDQIANALTYVRQEWGNNAPAVSPETVARIRAETAGRTAPWTSAELEKFSK